MEADADLDRAGCQRLCERGRRREWAGRGRKGEEEGVSLGIDLDATLGGARLPDDPAVLGEPVGVGLGPSECRSVVEPSTSVKRKVTVPVGRSSRTRRDHPPASIRRSSGAPLRRGERRVAECAGMSLGAALASPPGRRLSGRRHGEREVDSLIELKPPPSAHTASKSLPSASLASLIAASNCSSSSGLKELPRRSTNPATTPRSVAAFLAFPPASAISAMRHRQ